MAKLFASVASQLFTPRARVVKISTYSAGAVMGQTSGAAAFAGKVPIVTIA